MRSNTLTRVSNNPGAVQIPVDPTDTARISGDVENSIREKWSAQERIEKLRERLGGGITT